MTRVAVELTKQEAIARLEVSVDACRQCSAELDEKGFVASPHDGHEPQRRVVHSQLGGLGADWDEAHVLEFIDRAERVVEVPADHWLARTGHRIAVLGRYDDQSKPKWYAFTAA